MQYLVSIFIILLFATSGCSDTPVATTKPPSTVPIASSLSGELRISGTLALPSANATNAATLLENRPVELQDTSGNVVARGFADTKGTFGVSLPGELGLNIGSSAGASLTSSQDYQLVSLIEEDGTGKVLGLKQTISISAADVNSGSLNAGSLPFTEVSAIKGIIKFVDATNTENPKVPRIGTDVYLPGFSLAAKTDKDGKFLILYIPAASYTLRVERAAMVLEQDITVAASTTLNLGEIKILADTTPPITTASKDSTDFRSPMCINLSANKTGSAIYYTTDGSTPLATDAFKYISTNVTTCGSETNCPICVQNKSLTLKYFAVDTAGNAENQQAKFYFYNDKWANPADTTPPTTTLSANNQILTNDTLTSTAPKTVVLSTNEGATIYYTIDGTAPSTSSSIYLFPLTVSSSTTLRYFAVDWASNTETTKAKQLNIYQWTKLTPATTPTNYYNPTFSGMRFHPSMAYDPVRQKVILVVYDHFVAGAPSSRYLKTYEWSGTNWTETDQFSLTHDQMGDNSVQLPIFYDTVNQQMIMLLGKVMSIAGCGIDAYKYNPTAVSPKWTPLTIGNTTACPQASAFGPELVIANNTTNHKAMLLAKDSTTDGKIRYIDFSTPGSYNWTVAAQGGNNAFLEASNSIAAFADASLLYASGKTYFTGGRVVAMGHTYTITDAHYLDSQPTFTAIATGIVPQLFGGTLVHDSARDSVMLFGGCRGRDSTSPSPCSNSFFEFTGTDWMPTESASNPTPRRAAGVIFMPDTKKFLLFGGISEFDEMLADTWEYSY